MVLVATSAYRKFLLWLIRIQAIKVFLYIYIYTILKKDKNSMMPLSPNFIIITIIIIIMVIFKCYFSGELIALT